ncbi:CRISPR-associated helicase Cas3' [Paenibacillus sp. RC84]|uniref:CRISPR-associated helicase Cas3' n=1 Tax=Paenibacillus sp. RC84 TaxID=3156252 RepID=UPI003513A1A2
MYYAHRTDSDDAQSWQPLEQHLREVAKLSGEFAERFGAEQWGELVGWLHDAGKYSAEFQSRLRGTPIPVDHSTAGAKLIMERVIDERLGLIAAYVIAGHHAGLPDCGSLDGEDSCLRQRLIKKVCSYDAFHKEVPRLNMPGQAPSIQAGVDPSFQFSFFTRMLFSCLVDADSLNSEKFESPSRHDLRHHSVDIEELSRKFKAHMQRYFGKPRTPIEHIRSELLNELMGQADKTAGMYTLTLPTGSGKTLASLGFALEHARLGKRFRRIIYVIPYTSIIEQNAAIFRQVLGEDMVLEHHSNVQREVYEDEQDDEHKHKTRNLRDKLNLAEENWDYPVVVTTNVQFFESLFANRRSRCRKLHNLTDSIIILDEAQMMIGGFFKPSLYALEELVRNYGATVLLCTATQPPVSRLFPQNPRVPVTITELVKDVPLRYEQFKRVSLQTLGMLDEAALAEHLQAHGQVLCIVNTRKTARDLYHALKAENDEGSFHLSARMCPKHRLHVLDLIRKRLEQGLTCRVVSTQLIEAGVDVDFPAVYRELAGLDSIAQAAGRCNRNAKQMLGFIYVFETPLGSPPGWFRTTADVTRSVLKRYPDDPLSLSAGQEYFRELYDVQTLGQGDRTDSRDILPLLRATGARLEFPFREVADRFRLIDTVTRPVIVPYPDNSAANTSRVNELIEQLKYAASIQSILRKLQPYIVQLYPAEFRAFEQAREIVQVRADVWVLQNPKQWYDEKLGILPYSEQFHADEILII